MKLKEKHVYTIDSSLPLPPSLLSVSSVVSFYLVQQGKQLGISGFNR